MKDERLKMGNTCIIVNLANFRIYAHHCCIGRRLGLEEMREDVLSCESYLGVDVIYQRCRNLVILRSGALNALPESSVDPCGGRQSTKPLARVGGRPSRTLCVRSDQPLSS